MARLWFPFAGWLLLSLGLILGGCNFSPIVAPTPLSTPPPMATDTLSPLSPTPTPTPPDVAAITPADTPTPVTPSATPTITDTPGPFEHVLQEGDQLIAIVQTYGHRSLAVLDEVVTMNPNVPNADRLPPPGSVILIPRPTPTPTPLGGELTATFFAQHPMSPTPEMMRMTHVVEEGQTIIGIALQYNTTMMILSQLNPQLDWFGCDFAHPSGGPDCNPSLSIGQELVVPAPTPTPTLSPTPSGNETPTPTPTFSPVRLLWPSPGDIIAGGPLVLRWVSAGVLQPGEYYQVTVTDHTTGAVYTQFTQGNTLALPAELQPMDASPHEITWRVVVVHVRDDNVAVIVGALGDERPFQWRAP